MGRNRAGGRCTECGDDQLYALQMCKRCYQRNYMRDKREKEKLQRIKDQLEAYRSQSG